MQHACVNVVCCLSVCSGVRVRPRMMSFAASTSVVAACCDQKQHLWHKNGLRHSLTHSLEPANVGLQLPA